MIFIHEHKAHGSKAQDLCKKLWTNCSNWTIEAEFGYNTDGTKRAGEGELSILLNGTLAPLVTSQWIWICGIPSEDLGRLNIYAPNNGWDRRTLWHKLTLTLLTDYRWVAGGKFNMVERPRNESSNCSRLVEGRKSFMRAIQNLPLTWGLILLLQLNPFFMG